MKNFHISKQLFTENGSTAITSLINGGNGKLYIGFTSMDHPVLEYDMSNGKTRDIGLMFNPPANNMPLEDKVHNSLAIDENGILYIGQGLNIGWDARPYGYSLQKYGGGHLFTYDTKTECIEDHGIMVPRNAIHGITYNKETRRIYGYTIPDNHFFRYDIDAGTVTDYGKISSYASHNFVTDSQGNAYGAWLKEGIYESSEMAAKNNYILKGSFLLKFDRAKDELVRTKEMIVYGLEHDIFGNVGIDSWVRTSKGKIFGGTAINGVIFNITAEDRIKYVGKPVLGPRLTSMTEGPDGLIYGCAGFPHMSLFTLNPDTYEIEDLGILSNEGAFWYLHCIAFGDDGVIYGGETDAGKASLFKIIME
jgi:hypothetical protein